jgi:hypothetical protein
VPVHKKNGSATTMANIENVAGGARLNGTWERNHGSGKHPPKATERSPPDQSCEGQSARNPRSVAEHRRTTLNGERRRWVGQAATMPGGGSGTEHEHSILKKPCTNDPRGDAKDVPANEPPSRNGKLWRDGANENRKDETHTGQERFVGAVAGAKDVNVGAG